VIRIKLGIYGFGAIGKLVANVALERGYEISGAVDVNKEILDKDIGEIVGKEKIGAKVTNNLNILENSDVIIHTTGSFLDSVFEQLANIIKLGLPIVSSCETLSFPYYRYPILALKLDKLASSYMVPIIGTGINPGFIFDTLVATLSSSVSLVKKIKAIRSLDASKRRESFRKKIGVGEPPEVVLEKLMKKEISGHVGYAESVYLVALSGGVNLSKVEESSELILAEDDIEQNGIKVKKGMNKGMRGYGVGYLNDKDIVRIDFQAYVGAPEFEEISIEGKDYNITWKSTGTPGDLGTVSMLLNVAEKILYMPPGLHLMTELLPFGTKFDMSKF
jgi:4-hydroxy-tetrahydrodipicolinate reductase